MPPMPDHPSQTRERPYLTFLLPCYNEGAVLPETYRRIKAVAAGLQRTYEIVLVNDGSSDDTLAQMLRFAEHDPSLVVVSLSRNHGHQLALSAGLPYCAGERVLIMDADLQDPPELLPEMLALMDQGADVVYARRRSRPGDEVLKRVACAVFYRLLNRLAEMPIQLDTGDFRLMSRRVVNEVVKLKESHGFLRGMVAIVGFRQVIIPFDRPPRHAGETNYNRFFGSLRIGFNGIFCFSTYALQLSTILGFIIAGFSLLLTAIYLFYKLMGWTILWGNPTLVILISFLGGIQLISVGILGEYIGRIYEEVRGRPKFIVDQSVGFGPSR